VHEERPAIELDDNLHSLARDEIQASIAASKREIETKSGPALLDFILEDLRELKRILFDPTNHQVILAGMEATWWLNEKLEAWLGEKNAADTLAQSVPHKAFAFARDDVAETFGFSTAATSRSAGSCPIPATTGTIGR
jgi:hypothetical protein